MKRFAPWAVLAALVLAGAAWAFSLTRPAPVRLTPLPLPPADSPVQLLSAAVSTTMENPRPLPPPRWLQPLLQGASRFGGPGGEYVVYRLWYRARPRLVPAPPEKVFLHLEVRLAEPRGDLTPAQIAIEHEGARYGPVLAAWREEGTRVTATFVLPGQAEGLVLVWRGHGREHRLNLPALPAARAPAAGSAHLLFPRIERVDALVGRIEQPGDAPHEGIDQRLPLIGFVA